MTNTQLTERQRSILYFIEKQMTERGFPPSVREICSETGLSSPSTVHSHLEKLQKMGYLEKDPSTPRGIRVSWDSTSGASDIERRPAKHIPLVGNVAAGTDVLAHENIQETMPLPADFTGDGDLFMLQVRGDSMKDAGIFNGDYVVAKVQKTANDGDLVIAGIPNEEATLKHIKFADPYIELIPANEDFDIQRYPSDQVDIFGKVVTIMRCL